MLFNEPKLLKSLACNTRADADRGFSALQRAEIAEIEQQRRRRIRLVGFSALQRAEIAEIRIQVINATSTSSVSVLFNEPKLLKCKKYKKSTRQTASFSALQRAEIAEITKTYPSGARNALVSVLFNEPKLLKSRNIVRWRLETNPFQCSSTSRNC